MATPLYPILTGHFRILGTQPDGDTIHFVADTPAQYDAISRKRSLDMVTSAQGPSTFRADQTVRFDVVDAPEMHYNVKTDLGGHALAETNRTVTQPHWQESRDAVLAALGFTAFTPLAEPEKNITACTPETVPGAIIGKTVDRYGRIVSYLLSGADAAQIVRDHAVEIRHVPHVELDETVLKATLNYQLIAKGLTYYTMYSSTPYVIRPLMREAVTAAQQHHLGIWTHDQTARFSLPDADAIGPSGALILPKLFRRCSDYVQDRDSFGFPGTLPEWMYVNGNSDTVTVWLPGMRAFRADWASLIAQTGDQIALTVDALDVIFDDAT